MFDVKFWEEIKEKCPKAMGNFLLYLQKTKRIDDDTQFIIAVLWKLFENNDICYSIIEKFFRNDMIVITYHYSINGNGFKYFIYDKLNGNEYYDDKIFVDKENSENRAIKKAFEIRKNQLKDIQNEKYD